VSTVRYQISHTTTYVYSQPVLLQPHVVRLRPRSDGTQTLQSFSMLVSPTPQHQSPVVDLEGNAITKLWFDREPVTTLTVQVLSQVETYRTNPFDYLLDPWAVKLPIDYPSSILNQLQPYLAGFPATATLDPIALELAQEIAHQSGENPTHFLATLNQQIYQSCQYFIREQGDPFPPGLTWSKKAGSCRDLTVLFMECCRAVGLASRFVSGYQEGDLASTEEFHLHAWAEVYLPGGGWRGFDPTHGLAVGDRNVALAASPFPKYAAPITGAFSGISGVATARMSYQLMIQLA